MLEDLVLSCLRFTLWKQYIQINTYIHTMIDFATNISSNYWKHICINTCMKHLCSSYTRNYNNTNNKCCINTCILFNHKLCNVHVTFTNWYAFWFIHYPQIDVVSIIIFYTLKLYLKITPRKYFMSKLLNYWTTNIIRQCNTSPLGPESVPTSYLHETRIDGHDLPLKLRLLILFRKIWLVSWRRWTRESHHGWTKPRRRWWLIVCKFIARYYALYANIDT